MQCPSHLILVQPRDFSFNEETASSNSFQKQDAGNEVNRLAMDEFIRLSSILRDSQINFTVMNSPDNVIVPDAIFPNNWFAVIPDGKLLVFPMYTANRRAEVNYALLEYIEKKFKISERINFSLRYIEESFLEGTGSIVFDHDSKIAYACESPRTDLKLLTEMCNYIGYSPVSFLATDLSGKPVYHTNVVMSVGLKNVVICLETVTDILERKMLVETIKKSGKQIIEISYDQMNHFCGNTLLVMDKNNDPVWLMSETAKQHFSKEQIGQLAAEGRIVSADIQNIERVGGGSLRCMLAGIHTAAK